MSLQATLDRRHAGAYENRAGADKKSGFWSRFSSAFIAARQRSAEARVRYELSTLSDNHLKTLGLNERQISELRQVGRLTK
ncbi:MAG: hypothetical protein AAFQ45_10820 [Pseudomonadota bacterium]